MVRGNGLLRYEEVVTSNIVEVDIICTRLNTINIICGVGLSVGEALITLTPLLIPHTISTELNTPRAVVNLHAKCIPQVSGMFTAAGICNLSKEDIIIPIIVSAYKTYLLIGCRSLVDARLPSFSVFQTREPDAALPPFSVIPIALPKSQLPKFSAGHMRISHAPVK